EASPAVGERYLRQFRTKSLGVRALAVELLVDREGRDPDSGRLFQPDQCDMAMELHRFGLSVAGPSDTTGHSDAGTRRTKASVEQQRLEVFYCQVIAIRVANTRPGQHYWHLQSQNIE